MKYTAKTQATKLYGYYESLLNTHPCLADSIAMHKSLSSETVMDMAHNCDEKYAVWGLRVHGEEFDTEIRSVLLDKVVSPIHAIVLYINMPYWTDEEDEVLLAKFKDIKPRLMKALADGEITRAKDG